jgi:hypothetical protein
VALAQGRVTAAVQPRHHAAEMAVVSLLGWLALASIPIGLGAIGLGWDALNHHVYLGWVAAHPRFDRDFLAASYQAYQFPYLYWPLWKLVEAGVSGQVAGVVLVSLHALAVPALWLVAAACIPGTGWYERVMRGCAVALALSGELFLSLMDGTANDGLAAVPFVWSVAFAVLGTQAGGKAGWLDARRCVALSGFMAGVATACKLSNGPLALMLPVAWLLCGTGVRARAVQVVRGGMWTVFGFLLAYGWWGWQLWVHLGNPLFPFFGDWFAGTVK